MKKVLVTGATGYIGSHTVTNLLKEGYEVLGLDNYCNSQRETVESIKQITGKEFTCLEVDITDYSKLNEVFRENEISSIIHFAALKSVPESVSSPLEYYDNNVVGTLNLLKCMNEHKVSNLIYSSSATVYGNSRAVPYSEDAKLSATNPYGRTKLICEEILKDFSLAYPHLKFIILRYFNPIGADSSGLLADRPIGPPSNIMPNLCNVAIGKQEIFEICGDDYDTPDGSGMRDYVHVSDIADGHIKAMEFIDKINGTRVYNLGSGKPISVIELVNTFETVNNIKIPTRITKRRDGDVAISYADISLATKELGWTAKKSIQDMCAHSYKAAKINS